MPAGASEAIPRHFIERGGGVQHLSIVVMLYRFVGCNEG